MQLQALLGEVDAHWWRDPHSDGTAADTLDADLRARACESALGRRLLARWLAAGPAAALLAPAPGDGFAAVAGRWPRARLALLIRDLGALAFAPAIRAEIRRTPVRRLKDALGNSYLLALDRTVWDGHVAPPVTKRLKDALNAVLVDAVADDGDDNSDDAALLQAFDRQGRNELRAWALRNDVALGEWMTLLHPFEDAGAAHIPDAPALKLCLHHAARTAA